MSLVKQDFQTATWKRMSAHLHERLRKLREANDIQAKSPIETAAIRGQIAEVKALLDLARDASSSRNVGPDSFGDDD